MSRYALICFLVCQLVQLASSNCVGQFHSKVTSTVTVNTTRGPVIGSHYDLGSDQRHFFYGNGDVFLGIPYAQPPTGYNRWKKPVPLSTFPTSPHNATFLRPACPQLGGSEMDEDCLYLNIYSPNAKSTRKYPVMLWIHGGSLKSGSIRAYDPEGIIRNFVSRGVVVVTIQYRLAMLGFFTTFTEDFPPNRGMLDQVEAIKFVKEEIFNFGGNPWQITLFGESAGSASVAAHTFSPISQNLFQQAILQSGSVLTCFDGALGFQNISVHWAEKLCNFTVDDWNRRNYSMLWNCLSNMDYGMFLPLDSQLILGWNMVQDDLFLPDVPRVLAAKRPNIPVIYGNCRDEWALFEMDFMRDGILPFEDYDRDSFQLFFELLASYLATREVDVQGMLERVYLPMGTTDEDHLGWVKMQNFAFTSIGFTGFITREINWYLNNGNDRVYVYEFTHESDVNRFVEIPGWKPVFHSQDVSFVFMLTNHWMNAAEKGLVSHDDIVVANFFAEAWTNFAKFSQPSLNSTFWPQTSSAMNYLDISKSPTMKKDYRVVDSVLWDKVAPPLIGSWPPERPDFDNGTNGVDWTTKRKLISKIFPSLLK